MKDSSSVGRKQLANPSALSYPMGSESTHNALGFEEMIEKDWKEFVLKLRLDRSLG